jgi:hypothetical protein
VDDVDFAKVLIDDFIKINYRSLSKPYKINKKPNKDGKWVVNCRGCVKLFTGAKSLVNDVFVWGSVNDFDCSNNAYITSLYGAPEKVNVFSCEECINLKSFEYFPKKADLIMIYGTGVENLKGLPETYANIIDVRASIHLKSLEGAPKHVAQFYCYDCPNLETLKGAPETVDDIFDCNNCPNLKSLEGAPKEVKHFYTNNNYSLTSFKGAPKLIHGAFSGVNCINVTKLEMPNTVIGRNLVINSCPRLQSFEGAPKKIVDSVQASRCNAINSLAGLPDNIRALYMTNNNIETLDNCPKIIDLIDLHYYDVTPPRKPRFTVQQIKDATGVREVVI